MCAMLQGYFGMPIATPVSGSSFAFPILLSFFALRSAASNAQACFSFPLAGGVADPVQSCNLFRAQTRSEREHNRTRLKRSARRLGQSAIQLETGDADPMIHKIQLRGTMGMRNLP